MLQEKLRVLETGEAGSPRPENHRWSPAAAVLPASSLKPRLTLPGPTVHVSWYCCPRNSTPVVALPPLSEMRRLAMSVSAGRHCESPGSSQASSALWHLWLLSHQEHSGLSKHCAHVDRLPHSTLGEHDSPSPV